VDHGQEACTQQGAGEDLFFFVGPDQVERVEHDEPQDDVLQKVEQEAGNEVPVSPGTDALVHEWISDSGFLRPVAVADGPGRNEPAGGVGSYT